MTNSDIGSNAAIFLSLICLSLLRICVYQPCRVAVKRPWSRLGVSNLEKTDPNLEKCELFFFAFPDPVEVVLSDFIFRRMMN
jgi:hypothetical protein